MGISRLLLPSSVLERYFLIKHTFLRIYKRFLEKSDLGDKRLEKVGDVWTARELGLCYSLFIRPLRRC